MLFLEQRLDCSVVYSFSVLLLSALHCIIRTFTMKTKLVARMGSVVCFLKVSIFSIYSQVFFVTDAFLLFLSILACIYAFLQMRRLRFVKSDDVTNASAELLDRILLVVGLCGELVFSVGKMGYHSIALNFFTSF